jgi:hypothetical protein
MLSYTATNSSELQLKFRPCCTISVRWFGWYNNDNYGTRSKQSVGCAQLMKWPAVDLNVLNGKYLFIYPKNELTLGHFLHENFVCD